MNTQTVIKKYNENQDDIEVRDIFYDDELECWMVLIYYEYDGEKKTHCINRLIGFYQWLFAPQYKVCKIFKIQDTSHIFNFDEIGDEETFLYLCIREAKQPAEILKYLSKGGR